MKTPIQFILFFLLCLSVISCKKEDQLPLPEQLTPRQPLPMAIHSSTCILSGESLIVYDPNTSHFETYNADIFIVEWKIEDIQVGSGTHLECACGTTYTVMITDLTSGEIGKMDYTAIKCPNEE